MTQYMLLLFKAREEEIPKYARKLEKNNDVRLFSTKNHEYNVLVKVSGKNKETVSENVQNIIYYLDQESKNKAQ